jgi:hypothetical protein
VSLNLSKTFGLIRPMTRSLLLSTSTLTRFAVNGVEAALALDFISSEYRTANTATTFADAFMGDNPKLTYNPGSASSSQSTMTNSSGHLVWAPHNLLDYSEDFSQWGAGSTGTGVTPVVTPNAGTAPDGSLGADRVQLDLGGGTTASDSAQLNVIPAYGGTGVAYTLSVWMKSYDGNSYDVMLDFNGAAVQVETITNQWRLVSVTMAALDTVARPVNVARLRGAAGTSSTADILIYGAHVYRSDLGGMAPVPGAVGDFQYYVPTNGAAEYLPRVGHHVFNGSTWVNEGLLIESEVRTNLVTHSEDFSHASWTATKLEVGALVAGPDGASNVATTLTATDPSSSYTHKIDVRNVAPDPQTGTNTASIFVKQGTNRYVALTQEWSSNFTYAVYDLEGGVVTETGSGGTGSYVSSTMEPSGNGFWRISLSGSIGTSGSDAFVLLMSHTGTPNRRDPAFTASGTETIYVYGAQLEDAPTPSSYIPTSGSTVTRGGQSLTVPPAEFGWPEPEYIGPELVTNGGFDTDTVWTKGPGWTISGGVASCSGSSSSLVQNFTSVSGAVYAVSFDVSSYTSGTINTTVGGNYTAQQTVTNPTVGQTYNIVVVGGTNTTRGVEFYGGSFNGSIDNISVREINPLSVSFQMDGRMTYADESDFRQVSFGRWSQASTNELELRLNTGSTAVGKLQPLHDDNNEIAPLSVSDVYNPGSLVPFNVAARFGSNFLNAAADGSTMTALTTPTALPDLSNTDLQIAQDFMGTIGTFRQFAGDIGDAGLVTATNPSTEPTLSLTFDGTGGSFYNLNWSE